MDFKCDLRNERRCRRASSLRLGERLLNVKIFFHLFEEQTEFRNICEWVERLFSGIVPVIVMYAVAFNAKVWISRNRSGATIF